MDTTPLYRALIEAGAKEDTAKEAASAFSGKFDKIEETLVEIKTTIAEIKTTNKILIALVLMNTAILIQPFV